MKLTLIFVIFILANAFFIISNENLALKNPSNIAKFSIEYKDWIVKIAGNFKDVTGSVIKHNWIPVDYNTS